MDLDLESDFQPFGDSDPVKSGIVTHLTVTLGMITFRKSTERSNWILHRKL